MSIDNNKILNDNDLENVNGGLDMTLGLPKATKENSGKISNSLHKGKKPKAGDLILIEDSIKKSGPTMC